MNEKFIKNLKVEKLTKKLRRGARLIVIDPEKQYLDTLHIQMKKEMHLRMHNNDFDLHLRNVH